MEEERIMNYLKNLENLDFSEEDVGKKVMAGKYNRLDFSKAKGKSLKIESDFTNSLDLSDGTFKEVILVGRFNLVDASGTKIGLLDTKRAEIIILDDWKAKISEIRKP